MNNMRGGRRIGESRIKESDRARPDCCQGDEKSSRGYLRVQTVQRVERSSGRLFAGKKKILVRVGRLFRLLCHREPPSTRLAAIVGGVHVDIR